MSATPVRIGYIPLVDAATLVVATDFGFAAAENLALDLVREVSWSNVRDKLNIGLFDAAHLLSPVAIASSLGVGHVRVPIIAPFNLGLNGNAITVSPRLFAAISNLADGEMSDPMVTARALARVVADRRARGAEPLTFGMTFPFSNHNYQLRFWMAAAGIDPDEDVRLVVLPPSYMVESLASGHVDGFCVGAPWNSVAVESGVGLILHFGCEIMARVSEKVLAVSAQWAEAHADTLAALIRALTRAGEFADSAEHRGEVAAAVAQRLDVPSDLVFRTLAGNLKTAPDGTTRVSDRYIMIGRNGANRPDPTQAAWLYAQIVRWRQAPASQDLCALAQSVFRSDLYQAALREWSPPHDGEPRDGIGCFIGPQFDAANFSSYLAAWSGARRGHPHLSLVR